MGDLLTGQLAYVFLAAILDAAVISSIALRWYRRSVRRLMRERGAQSPVTDVAHSGPDDERAVKPHAAAAPPTAELFDTADAASPAFSEPGGASRRKLVIAYCAGAALHAAMMTILVLGVDTSLAPAAWFGQWWVFAWPIVPTLVAVLVLSRRDGIRLGLGYIVVGALATALVTLAGQALRGSFNDAPMTNAVLFVKLLAETAWVPLALLLITGRRRIRSVAPLALSATLVFGFALLLFRAAFTEALNITVLQSALLGAAALTTTQVMYYGLFMILVLPVGWVPWRLLQLLAARYERKRFSDVQLIVDCWWLIVTAEQIVTNLTSPYGAGGIAAGLAAFAVYRVTVALCLSRLPDPGRASVATKRLLLLRVFGYEARTETLFDRVAQRWRFHGPVQLIAGVDLAMRAVDPGDILAFVSGRLDQRYVKTSGDVGRRIGELDMQRDADGRFRINEVYCHADNWRPTLQALLDASDIVLMDLRSFSSANAGCVYELEQLVSRLEPQQIVFVYDQTTDLRLLGNCLADGWRRAVHSSPQAAGSISCVRVERNSWSELQLLLRRLTGAEQPHRVVALADLASA